MQPQAIAQSSGYIVSPRYDWFFFILSPLLAIALARILTTPLSEFIAQSELALKINSARGFVFNALYIPLIQAHLFIVIFRSHFNKSIRKLYPIRFFIVPVLLFAVVMLSDWALVVVAILGVWWDVYHSSLQTFGLGRIYDKKCGNDAHIGRKLDLWLNIVIYSAPIFAGLSLIDHLRFFHTYNKVGLLLFETLPHRVMSFSDYLKPVVISLGTAYIIYYFFAYWRLHKQGYKISFQKVFLLQSTALCTLFGWGFNSFGQAFFIVNFFHAFQYFAIVWWFERKNMAAVFRLDKYSHGQAIAFLLFIAIGYGYGWWSSIYGTNIGSWTFALTLVISIMHFWYDGFIWSVRKNQV